MNNCATIVKINSITKHTNADKLQIVNIFGTQVITDLSTKEGDLMIYFDSNLQLSHEYCHYNNLYKHKEINEDNTKEGYIENNRRVKAIKLRGEFSDGMLMPLSSLNYITTDIKKFPTEFGQGFEFNDLLGHKVCNKYIPITKTSGEPNQLGNKKRKKSIISPMFVEHLDTSQFFKNQHNIPANTLVYIMEKTHGTSGRIAYSLVNTTNERSWIRRMFMKLAGIESSWQYRYIHGSRRVSLGEVGKNYQPFHDPTMREAILEKVKGLLEKGQQIYFEIYGYEPTGKEIQKGFSYGCSPKEYKVKLYRVTMNNEDGKVVDYSIDYVINKAKELNFEAPYIFHRFYYDGSKESMKKLEELVVQYAQGQSTMDSGTLKEGVIVQFINSKGNWDYLKYKSDAFRLMESGNKDKGIIDQEDIN